MALVCLLVVSLPLLSLSVETEETGNEVSLRRLPPRNAAPETEGTEKDSADVDAVAKLLEGALTESETEARGVVLPPSPSDGAGAPRRLM